MIKDRISILGLIILMFFGCNPINQEGNISISWTEMLEKSQKGIRIYCGRNTAFPLNAWYAEVDLNHEGIQAKIISATDEDKREKPSQLLQNINATVILNGGYFIMRQSPTNHVGLLKVNGDLLEPASQTVIRDNARYFVTRGAVSFDTNNHPDIAWVTTRNDSIFYWDIPIANRPGHPAEPPNFNLANYWNVKEALHAGPILIQNGKVFITTEEEVFFNTPIAGVQPRSALGITKNNHLILLVVDGRQTESRGVYLEELAAIMLDLNCEEAINLDGGGSSALVTKEGLLNRPIGLGIEREIMSAIAIFTEENE